MISLLFCQGQDIGARVIQWFGHGPYSHVEGILLDGPKAGWLLGSRSDSVGGAPPGVQIRDPAYLNGLKTLRVDLPCSDLVTGRAYDWAHSQIGKPYDQTAIAGFVSGRDWQEDDSWFCSEYWASAIEKCSYFPYKPAVPANKIDPNDLLLMLSVLAPISLGAPQ